MFGFLKKEIVINSPVIGKAIAIEEVPDPMFAQKMLGDGVAFMIDGDTIYAPCDCEIVMVATTKHAIGLKVKDVEILIHIGIDTVNYNVEGFEVMVDSGEQVKMGQALVRVNMEFFKEKEVNLITPLVITTPDVKLEHLKLGDVNLDSQVLKMK